MRKTTKYLSFIALGVVLVLAGCSNSSNNQPNNQPQQPNQSGQSGQQQNNDQGQNQPDDKPSTLQEKLKSQSDIKKFASIEEAREFFQNNSTQSTYSGYASGGMMGMGEMRAKSASDAISLGDFDATESVQREATNQAAGPSSDVDYSKTNVQVEGVDEADIIKTDGDYVYALSQNNVFIIEARPAEEAEILSKIEFKNSPQDIYINDDRMAVFGRDNEFPKTDTYSQFRRRNSYTFFKVFDLSDRKNPKEVRDMDFEGNYSNSRMIGDYVYFVTDTHNYHYIEDEPVLPRILEDGEVLAFDCEEAAKCLEPEIYYFPMPYDRYNYTTITSINLRDADETVNTETYLMSGNQNMYVSQNNMYITYTKHISEYELEMEVLGEIVYPRLPESDQEKIAKIEDVENFILSPREKRQKINAIIERYGQTLTDDERDKLEEELENAIEQKYEDISKELEKTVIHKVNISDGELEYQTNGEVTGHVLNQFSMDERDGYFRIATTKRRTWSRHADSTDSYSNLYVLDTNLNQVGAVEELAEGERIYSVRFMQDRAYMVTFKQVDPLFVIDLKDPEDPQVLGELKIPGYSDYLHPYDNDLLIGLGRQTEASEWGGVSTKGVKLSLFDVSDVTNPTELDTYIIGDSRSNSAALHDHKAFLFSREKNLLVIPVTLRNSIVRPMADSEVKRYENFRGAAVFRLDKEGFDLSGKIDHNDGTTSGSRYWNGYNYYDTTVKRSLYIEDILYTFSDKYLKMNSLDDLTEMNNLKLQMDDDDYKIIN